MTFPLLAQDDRWKELSGAVRKEFAGDSLRDFLLILLTAGLVVLMVYLIRRAQQRKERFEQQGDPKKLFREVLDKLPLAAEQRQFLDALAVHTAVEHPTVLLLSASLFERESQRWLRSLQRQSGDSIDATDVRRIATTRAVLFPALE